MQFETFLPFLQLRTLLCLLELGLRIFLLDCIAPKGVCEVLTLCSECMLPLSPNEIHRQLAIPCRSEWRAHANMEIVLESLQCHINPTNTHAPFALNRKLSLNLIMLLIAPTRLLRNMLSESGNMCWRNTYRHAVSLAQGGRVK